MTQVFKWKRRRKRDFRKTYPMAAAMQDILPSALEALGMDADRQRLSRLWECWPFVLGQELAPLACPLGTRDDTLLVGCEDNMCMQEITLRQDEILERVNAFMEKAYFHNVKASLFMGRNDLSMPPANPHAAPEIPPSSVRGTYLDAVTTDTPWGRCYAAWAGQTTCDSPAK